MPGAWSLSTAPRKAARFHPHLERGRLSRGFPLTGERGWGRRPCAPITSAHIGAGCEGGGAGRRPIGKQLPRQLPRPGPVGSATRVSNAGGRRHDGGTTDQNLPGTERDFCARGGSGFCLRKGSCPARPPPSRGSGVHPSVLRRQRASGPDGEGNRARSNSATNLMAPDRGGSLQPGPARASSELENRGESSPG